MIQPNEHRSDCRVDRLEFPKNRVPMEGAETLVVRISGMGCVHCANRVHNALARQSGVLDVVVDHSAAAARLVFDPERMDIRAIVRAVASAGDDRHAYRVLT